MPLNAAEILAISRIAQPNQSSSTRPVSNTVTRDEFRRLADSLERLAEQNEARQKFDMSVLSNFSGVKLDEPLQVGDTLTLANKLDKIQKVVEEILTLVKGGDN